MPSSELRPINNLRQHLRSKRRALSRSQQAQSAQKVAIRVAKHPWFKQAQKMAFYWPADGELDPRPLLKLALKMGKHCYLPIIQANKSLLFAPYSTASKLQLNRFNIPEPLHRKQALIPSKQLDLIFMPLVGFDDVGNRLGMGGGFYDRSLASNSWGPKTKLPRKIGLAHSVQEVGRLQSERWDVPLLACVTELAFTTYRL